MPLCRGLILFLALLCLPVLPAPAQDGLRTEGEVATAQGLYSGEVVVASQADAARQAGYARALAQVWSGRMGGGPAANLRYRFSRRVLSYAHLRLHSAVPFDRRF